MRGQSLSLDENIGRGCCTGGDRSAHTPHRVVSNCVGNSPVAKSPVAFERAVVSHVRFGDCRLPTGDSQREAGRAGSAGVVLMLLLGKQLCASRAPRCGTVYLGSPSGRFSNPLVVTPRACGPRSEEDPVSGSYKSAASRPRPNQDAAGDSSEKTTRSHTFARTLSGFASASPALVVARAWVAFTLIPHPPRDWPWRRRPPLRGMRGLCARFGGVG